MRSRSTHGEGGGGGCDDLTYQRMPFRGMRPRPLPLTYVEPRPNNPLLRATSDDELEDE
ncbi:MAG: hypothetical protein Phog2KO_47770 [Phototrophicaceae bacterium]